MKRIILATLVAAAACCAQDKIVTNNADYFTTNNSPSINRYNSALSYPLVPFREGSFLVSFELVTNWTTIHEEPLTTTNTNGPTLCRQAGQVFSNNIALILWNSVTNRVSLESVPLDLAVLPQRTITNEPTVISNHVYYGQPQWNYLYIITNGFNEL